MKLPSQEDIALEDALRGYLEQQDIKDVIDGEHINRTPQRFVKALHDLMAGIDEDPARVLSTSFSEDDYDQMIVVKRVHFVSLCAHHLLPFLGYASFAYIPDKRIVGLSKIARVIEIYTRRPQVQEKLTQQIVSTFQNIMEPRGCGLVMEASHLCMSIRGVKKFEALTRTTALAGVFADDVGTKMEFLEAIR